MITQRNFSNKILLILVVFVIIIIGLSTKAVQAAEPVIFFSDLTSGPNTGGQDNKGVFVTIWGKNFGSTRGNSTVTVGGGLVDNYPEWSDTKVCFQLGTNTSTGDIKLTTGEGVSNTIPFTIRSGNIYFITPDGTGDGSFNNPMSPSDYVTVTQSEDGATGYFRGGIYNHEYGHPGWHYIIMLEKSNAGAPGAPNAFVGYPGEVALFKTQPEGTVPDRGGFAYAKTDNYNPTDYIVLSKISFDTRLGAIEADSNWRVVGNDIEAGDTQMTSGQITMGRYWPDVNSNYYTSHDIKILGNTLHGGRSHTHLDHCIYPAAGTKNLEIAWNSMYDNDFDNGPLISINMNEAYAKNLISTGINIHDNHIDTTTYPARQFGTYELGAGSEVYYYNNVLVGHSQNSSGTIYAMSGTVHYFNNTSYDAGSGNMGSVYSFYCSDVYSHHYCPDSVEMKNNVIYANPSSRFYIRNTANVVIDQDYNLWYGIGDFNSNSENALIGSHGINNQNPKFVSTSNFHLQSTSPARNAGTTIGMVTRDYDGNPRPQGSAYDIGAYEYQESGSTVIRADVDNNSQINSTDAMLTLRNSLGLDMSATDWQASSTTGDVNCDGTSNSTDAMLILRYSLGLSMEGTGWCVE